MGEKWSTNSSRSVKVWSKVINKKKNEEKRKKKKKKKVELVVRKETRKLVF